MSALRRILVGDGGLGATLGAALIFGAGLVLVVVGAIDLSEAFRREPRAVACAELVAQEGHARRWISVTACRLDLARQLDGGSGRWAALVPGSADAGLVYVELREPELLALAGRLEQRSGDPESALLTAPATISGHLEPIEGDWQLVPGRPVPTGASLFAFLLGTVLLVVALRPVALRWLLHRDR